MNEARERAAQNIRRHMKTQQKKKAKKDRLNNNN